jgi:hypothetical protein
MTTGFVFGGMAQEQYQKRGKDLKKLEEKQILLHEEGEGNLLYLLVDQPLPSAMVNTLANVVRSNLHQDFNGFKIINVLKYDLSEKQRETMFVPYTPRKRLILKSIYPVELRLSRLVGV